MPIFQFKTYLMHKYYFVFFRWILGFFSLFFLAIFNGGILISKCALICFMCGVDLLKVTALFIGSSTKFYKRCNETNEIENKQHVLCTVKRTCGNNIIELFCVFVQLLQMLAIDLNCINVEVEIVLFCCRFFFHHYYDCARATVVSCVFFRLNKTKCKYVNNFKNKKNV